MFLCRGDIGFGRHIDAEVDDFKPLALHHHFDEILADVVEVAAHRAEDDLSGGLNIRGDEIRL